jgi:two-component SAPR family response regulator
MLRKLNCALIVDEDRATNIFNKMVVSRHASFKKVDSVQNTEGAIEYLQSIDGREVIKPDAIFIGYAATGLNGNDFFVQFNQLNRSITKGVKIFIMAPHCDPKILKNSGIKYPIAELIKVPLSFPVLEKVLEKHFLISNFTK